MDLRLTDLEKKKKRTESEESEVITLKRLGAVVVSSDESEAGPSSKNPKGVSSNTLKGKGKGKKSDK